MQFNNIMFNKADEMNANYFYEVEYLPSIFDGRVDKESLF